MYHVLRNASRLIQDTTAANDQFFEALFMLVFILFVTMSISKANGRTAI